MSALALPVPNLPVGKEPQAVFLALLPKLQRQALIDFRHIRCPAKKADQVAESIALGWRRYLRLVERGVDVTRFPMAFVLMITKGVKCGRRLCGQEKARDVLSPTAQRRRRFRVEGFLTSSVTRSDHPSRGVGDRRAGDVFEERLRDNTQTPVPEQVQFRIDFPAWLQTLTPRERQVLNAMARNERNKDLSLRFRVSSARISQLRRAFKESWQRYCGDESHHAAGHR